MRFAKKFKRKLARLPYGCSLSHLFERKWPNLLIRLIALSTVHLLSCIQNWAILFNPISANIEEMKKASCFVTCPKDFFSCNLHIKIEYSPDWQGYIVIEKTFNKVLESDEHPTSKFVDIISRLLIIHWGVQAYKTCKGTKQICIY